MPNSIAANNRAGHGEDRSHHPSRLSQSPPESSPARDATDSIPEGLSLHEPDDPASSQNHQPLDFDLNLSHPSEHDLIDCELIDLTHEEDQFPLGVDASSPPSPGPGMPVESDDLESDDLSPARSIEDWNTTPGSRAAAADHEDQPPSPERHKRQASSASSVGDLERSASPSRHRGKITRLASADGSDSSADPGFDDAFGGSGPSFSNEQSPNYDDPMEPLTMNFPFMQSMPGDDAEMVTGAAARPPDVTQGMCEVRECTVTSSLVELEQEEARRLFQAGVEDGAPSPTPTLNGDDLGSIPHGGTRDVELDRGQTTGGVLAPRQAFSVGLGEIVDLTARDTSPTPSPMEYPRTPPQPPRSSVLEDRIRTPRPFASAGNRSTSDFQHREGIPRSNVSRGDPPLSPYATPHVQRARPARQNTQPSDDGSTRQSARPESCSYRTRWAKETQHGNVGAPQRMPMLTENSRLINRFNQGVEKTRAFMLKLDAQVGKLQQETETLTQEIKEQKREEVRHLRAMLEDAHGGG